MGMEHRPTVKKIRRALNNVDIDDQLWMYDNEISRKRGTVTVTVLGTVTPDEFHAIRASLHQENMHGVNVLYLNGQVEISFRPKANQLTTV